VAANEHVFEFKTDIGQTPHISDLYKPRHERSVEIHLCDSTRPDRHPELLNRAGRLSLDGASYPALSREDMFIAQAYHLFRHLRSEWTRPSWLLEFKHFVEKYREEKILWNAIRSRVNTTHDGGLAIGFAICFAERVLGAFGPQELTHWTVPEVPSETALWVERYANKIALTDFPGSKLYLILEHTLSPGGSTSNTRSRLFPTRVPAAVVAAPSTGLVPRIRAGVSRAAYFCFRLRFHLTATSQYFVENWRWNRHRSQPALQLSGSSQCSANTVD